LLELFENAPDVHYFDTVYNVLFSFLLYLQPDGYIMDQLMLHG